MKNNENHKKNGYCNDFKIWQEKHSNHIPNRWKSKDSIVENPLEDIADKNTKDNE